MRYTWERLLVLFAFAVAIFLLVITPGPGVLTLAGVGSAFGYRSGFLYFTGLLIGNNFVALAVISGLAAVLTTFPSLAIMLVVLSTGYLLYLAAKIAFSGSKIAFIQSENPPGFWGGLALQAINPKAYVVNTTIFGSFHFMANDLGSEITLKLIIFNAIWIPIHFLWLWAGVAINSLNLTPQKQRAVNITMALAMVIVVALAFAYKG